MKSLQTNWRSNRILKAAQRLWKRLPKAREQAAAAVAPAWTYSQMPFHDRPSGYFSARDEGKLKNTTVVEKTAVQPRSVEARVC